MSLHIARRMKHVGKSLIREIAEAANKPGVISFANGNPGTETYQCEKFAQIAQRALTEAPISMLKYGNTLGYEPLREVLKEYLSSKWGIDFKENELLITSGGQQDCDITAKVLLDEGDCVITEEPSFASCFNAFRSYGGRLVGVPLEEDGMSIEDLERAIGKNPNTRIIYIIPNFQNPSGYTTSWEKRQAIYELAQKYNLAIFEDDPYVELRFAGKKVLPIKSLDRDGRVVYGGTFSKTLAPGMRVGFLVFGKEIEPQVTVAKQAMDVHANILFQHIACELMKEGYEEHLQFCCETYRRKCDLMMRTLEQVAPAGLAWNRPEGGLFISLFLPKEVDTYKIVFEAIREGVACVPGAAFMIDQNTVCNNLRLCYATSSEKEIVEGIHSLCRFVGRRLNAFH